MNDFYLVGHPPNLRGQEIQAFLGETLQQSLDPAEWEIIVHVQLNGQWWRLFVDGPNLYWKRTRDNEPPVAWDLLPEQEYRVKVRNLGTELDVCGALLESWSFGVQNDRPRASLNLRDGRQITFSCTDNWMGFTTVEVVVWTFN